MSTEKQSTSLPTTLLSFFALYLTTLFSMDTWNAARGSPYRSTIDSSTYFRPAVTRPSPDSYQGRYSANGHRPGTRPDLGARGVGRVGGARDSRPPLRLVGTSSCGACG
ncbi:hypothetical protein BCR34DRAFT_601927 [Clohesyomyces aquaticus]|uniref:Uncharacterized protein n=1 Tax=Clohesyomyces aquaticus TaxID=1231657 RepID=A0A1Y1ZKT2_9PLEO|nr:hypothetical protein BCR34DRAFT_601927 [Clohesyomyces aquaticus]